MKTFSLLSLITLHFFLIQIANADEYLSFSLKALKGDKDAQYTVAMIELDSQSRYFNVSRAENRLRSMAKQGHIESIYYLAQSYSLGDQIPHHPSRSNFWFNFLIKKGKKVDPHLYQLNLIYMEEYNDVSVLNSDLTGLNTDMWTMRLLKAKKLELGIGIDKDLNQSLAIYLSLLNEGRPVSYIAKSVFEQSLTPKIDGELLYRRDIHKVNDFLTLRDRYVKVPSSKQNYSFYKPTSSLVSPITFISMRSDDDGVIEEVTMYLVPKDAKALKANYINRLGMPSEQDKITTKWDFTYFVVWLIEEPNKPIRLITAKV